MKKLILFAMPVSVFRSSTQNLLTAILRNFSFRRLNYKANSLNQVRNTFVRELFSDNYIYAYVLVCACVGMKCQLNF
jgi:hypothetical protein